MPEVNKRLATKLQKAESKAKELEGALGKAHEVIQSQVEKIKQLESMNYEL